MTRSRITIAAAALVLAVRGERACDTLSEGMNPNLAEAGLATRWKPGQHGGSAGNVTKAEREWREHVDKNEIPRAAALMESTYQKAIAGDMIAAALWFKVCGLIRRTTDDAAIQKLAQELLDGMIAEAKARRG